MCVVEVKGQPKLATSCSTAAAEGMEVSTCSPAVLAAREGTMEFLSLNHPLDCPLCDKAGECKLQDYAYLHGSSDGRAIEEKTRFGYEDLGAKIVLDKNRCIHCTRCVRFTREITGQGELTVANRGSHLEITTFEGLTLDSNPFACNIIELCPAGAMTSRDFRFKKRAWYLRPIPTISRHGADAKPIWADVDQNRLWRFRPRFEGESVLHRMISDEERLAWHRYDLEPSQRRTSPTLKGKPAKVRDIAKELFANAPIAVLAQATFGCGALQQVGELASLDSLRYAHGNKKFPIQNPSIQLSDDGAINKAGALERGYRFGAVQELLSKIEAKEVKAVVIYHDSELSDAAENELLAKVAKKARFSLVLEPIPSGLSDLASATLPVTTYLEESDFVIDHQGDTKPYQKALEPPKGIMAPGAWATELKAAAVGAVGAADAV
jgi:NADH-quinone oxidoreductase subunit G